MSGETEENGNTPTVQVEDAGSAPSEAHPKAGSPPPVAESPPPDPGDGTEPDRGRPCVLRRLRRPWPSIGLEDFDPLEWTDDVPEGAEEDS